MCTFTSSGSIPRVSAATCAVPVRIPCRSTAPIETSTLPSWLTITLALEISIPQGHHPIPTPLPTGQPFSLCFIGRLYSSDFFTCSSISTIPIRVYSSSSTFESPVLEAFLIRKSMGSYPIAEASSSSVDSPQNVATVAPGARYAATRGALVTTS